MALFHIQHERTQIFTTIIEAPTREAAEAYAELQSYNYNGSEADRTEYEDHIEIYRPIDPTQPPTPDEIVDGEGNPIDADE